MITCANPQCHRSTNTPRYGLCNSCYVYWRKHARLRPAGSTHRSRHEPLRLCTNCRLRYANHTRQLCNTCYNYRRKHGRNRPRYLDAAQCTHCRRPDNRLRKGLCNSCYNYRHYHGRPKPRQLIRQQAPLGWCDCGQPAIKTITTQGAYQFTMDLCQACLALETDADPAARAPPHRHRQKCRPRSHYRSRQM
jgi:hypothetical protein